MANRIRMMFYAVIFLTFITASSLYFLLAPDSFSAKVFHPGSDIQSALKKSSPAEVTPVYLPEYSLEQLSMIFDAFSKDLSFVGKGIYAVAWDTKTGKFYDLYNQNADKPFNAASITKLVTALSLAKNEQKSKDFTALSASNLPSAEIPPSEGGKMPLHLYQKKDLLAALLISSSNIAAYTLANPYGLENFNALMNKEGKRLGLTNSVFRDPSGYDYRQKQSASYMSPKDVARVSFELINRFPELTSLTAKYQYDILNKDGNTYTLRNTNPLVQNTPHVLLSKTGYTDLAGGNLTMVVEPEPGVWVSIVVMQSTKDGRFDDMRKLVSTVDKSFSLYKDFYNMQLRQAMKSSSSYLSYVP